MAISPAFRAGFDSFFAATPAGTVFNYFDGQLIKNADGSATWTGLSDHANVRMVSGGDIDSYARQSPSLAAQWGRDWGYTPPIAATAVVPTIQATIANVTAAVSQPMSTPIVPIPSQLATDTVAPTLSAPKTAGIFIFLAVAGLIVWKIL